MSVFEPVLSSPKTPEAQRAVDACAARDLSALQAVFAAPAETWDAWSQDGSTPLLEAANQDWAEGVSALLANGANPSRLSESGASALEAALLGPNLEIANALLNAGSDPSAGIASPLALACENAAKKCHLLNRWTQRHGTTHIVSQDFQNEATSAMDVCLRLIQAGANPHGVNDDQTPALLLSLKPGMEPVARALVEAGADVNCKEPKDHFSALYILCNEIDFGLYEQAQSELVGFLLDKGADPAAKTRLGLSVNHNAHFFRNFSAPRQTALAHVEHGELMAELKGAQTAADGDSAATNKTSAPAPRKPRAL